MLQNLHKNQLHFHILTYKNKLRKTITITLLEEIKQVELNLAKKGEISIY